ncbi:MAG: hypothetical protein R3B90_06620 [Planctomycetaceae bacterium]
MVWDQVECVEQGTVYDRCVEQVPVTRQPHGIDTCYCTENYTVWYGVPDLPPNGDVHRPQAGSTRPAIAP